MGKYYICDKNTKRISKDNLLTQNSYRIIDLMKEMNHSHVLSA